MWCDDPTTYRTCWCHVKYCISVRISLSPQKHFTIVQTYWNRGREHILAACFSSLWKELISFSCPQFCFPDRTSSHAEYKSYLLHQDWDTQSVTITQTISNPIKYNQLVSCTFGSHCMACRHATCRYPFRSQILFLNENVSFLLSWTTTLVVAKHTPMGACTKFIKYPIRSEIPAAPGFNLVCLQEASSDRETENSFRHVLLSENFTVIPEFWLWVLQCLWSCDILQINTKRTLKANV